MESIEEYITCVENKINESIIDVDMQPRQLYDPVNYILSNGGKRIRSLFTLLSCQAYSGKYNDAVSVAAGLEVFHNFTLLHDDIMDKATIRRGIPTVHEKWGTNTAILSGDAMMILGADLVAKAPIEVLQSVLKIFNKTALQVCEGQQLDMQLEALRLDDSSITSETYIEMIRLKTSVLLAACLQIGALIGGANNEEQLLIYNAGISLGLGFQLQDDFLDSFGEEKSFGKKIGGDIIARKKTYLVSSAIESANSSQQKKLIELYNSTNINDTDLVNRVKELFIETGANVDTETKINFYYKKAFDALKETKTTNSSAKQLLFSLFDQVSQRKK